MKAVGFWDSSALVPLCVQETGTRTAHALVRRFQVVIWWGTPVEIHGAIARAIREQRVDADTLRKGLRRLEFVSAGWQEVAPSDDLRKLAGQLLYNHSLRAADALQLAAAMTWCRHKAKGRVLVLGDMRLAEAARILGFDIAEVS